ncbi:MAG TPA: Fur family transcriptional regulator [Candidatus Saccharimonadales bacterium]|nr:Fur family transcriptional regulator [Candidatus Saccharimonadales bacterium]
MLLPLEQLKSALRDHGYSLTLPRRVVFEALQGQEPQTMRELVAGCADRIDRATLYRTVALFEQLGIVQRLQIGWKYKLELAGAFAPHHHHLSCSRCGAIIVLPEDSVIEARLHALAHARQFLAQDHQLEIRGLCADCQQLSA